ncbi:MAG: sensor histidine kinase [Candidatus Acidiferrales bacterium]
MTSSRATRAVRLALVVLFVGLLTGFHHSIGLTNPTTAALSLLLVVLAVAAAWGLAEAIVTSLVAAACFNFFFLPPLGTWTIADPQNWVALFSFLVVSIVAGQLSERARRKAREALAHQQETTRLAELAQRAEMVRQSEEFRSTLLDALAHELKTPLTSLKASLSALRAAPEPPANRAELLAIAEEETDRLHRLVSEVLHMARLEAGKLRLNREACAVDTLIRGGVEDARRVLDGRRLDVRENGPLPRVSADAELIRTVLRHLLDNAAKYSAPGGRIVVSAEQGENGVSIRVADSGPGLSEKETERIFERYYRSARTRDAVPGMGIGLAISREIVAAHGGRLWAESSPGQGTTLVFTLPLAEGAEK